MTPAWDPKQEIYFLKYRNNQSVIQSIRQSLSQSVSQSVNQSISKSIWETRFIYTIAMGWCFRDFSFGSGVAGRKRWIEALALQSVQSVQVFNNCKSGWILAQPLRIYAGLMTKFERVSRWTHDVSLRQSFGTAFKDDNVIANWPPGRFRERVRRYTATHYADKPFFPRDVFSNTLELKSPM